MENKKAAPTEANATQAHRTNSRSLKLCPRQERVAHALLVAGERWTWREDIDRIAGASNGPEIISALRRKGIEIDMQKVESKDRDGKPCKPGQYRLSSRAADKLAAYGLAA